MKRKALITSVALSALFLVVYGGTNTLTGMRHDVGVAAMAWERSIPFIPWTIVPYMSIDLFFVAAPFFCRTDRERRTLARRLAACVLIAGACFLLFPLRFSFDRPPVEGWVGAVFDAFGQMDRPFNECPSLHIALGTVLAAFFVPRLRGVGRAATAVWFGLIGLSALTTYQHHVVDVIGGFALAAICIHLFQDAPFRRPRQANARVGLRYLAGAALLAAAAFVSRPWSLVLLWPAASLVLVAAGYLLLGVRVYRKRNGRLSLTTWLLLWPVLAGQRLSLAWYARNANPWDALDDRVVIGRRLNAREAQRAIDAGVGAVVDLAGEFSEVKPFRSLPYCGIDVLDLTAPTNCQTDRALSFIAKRAGEGKIYVHCKAGYSRTAVIAGAYLLASGRARTAADAVCLLRAARPSMIVRPEAMAAIEAFQGRLAHAAAASAPSIKVAATDSAAEVFTCVPASI